MHAFLSSSMMHLKKFAGPNVSMFSCEYVRECLHAHRPVELVLLHRSSARAARGTDIGNKEELDRELAEVAKLPDIYKVHVLVE